MQAAGLRQKALEASKRASEAAARQKMHETMADSFAKRAAEIEGDLSKQNVALLHLQQAARLNDAAVEQDGKQAEALAARREASFKAKESVAQLQPLKDDLAAALQLQQSVEASGEPQAYALFVSFPHP